MRLNHQAPITPRGHNRYLLELRQLARDNRKNPTKTESLLWNVLLKKRLLGFKFLRQKPIDRFILDFYCPKLLLAIEVDGDSHDQRKNHDCGRDHILSIIGTKTVRFTNQAVQNSLALVIKEIRSQINIRANEI